MVKIRLCPKCKKPTLRNATNVSGWLAPDMFECSDEKCGYVGHIYLEVDTDDIKGDAKEEPKKNKKKL
ncbi:MAG: hypothetical protein EU539_11425 [Promethearchaeota archaeon]|nr:MAG: hypothetical protein EU539_11425 [Candidatus Lokiarchaeota archaeon]